MSGVCVRACVSLRSSLTACLGVVVRSIRALLVAFATLLLGVCLAAPASARPAYPPIFNGMSVSPHKVCAQHKITVKAQTFTAHATTHYRVKVHGQAVAHGTVDANRHGKVVKELQLKVPGTNTITVTGPGKKGKRLHISIAVPVKHCHVYRPNPSPSPTSGGGVVGPADSGGGSLLRTGALIGSGLALLLAFVAGALLLVSGMRRRRPPQQPVT
jgi:hypothetical protein